MDMLLATAIAVISHSIFFIAGMIVSDRYNDREAANMKDALERQYVRLMARADADDPCKPYVASYPLRKYVPQTGDYDGDEGPIPPEFMEELKENGKAVAKFRKSDLTK